MQKTPFAGLTALEPNESIYSDNSAFVERDRFEIDRGLKIGIKTHRHDELEGLSPPQHAPSGLVIGSGGSIPGGLSLTLGLTYEDVYGGETLLGPTRMVTTPSPIQAPTQQLEAEAKYDEGTLSVDTYTYAYTFVDANGGETPLGPPVVVTRQPGFGNARITLFGFGEEADWAAEGIKAWRLYRSRAGGEYVFLAETETDAGAPHIFIDDGSVSPDCDRHPPNFNLNTTGGANQIEVILGAKEEQFASEVERVFINLYCSQSGTFDESCLVAQYPAGSANAVTFVSSLGLLDAQPPDVNRSYGGADKIDPDTELIDYHWKRPVQNKSELPDDGEEGDVRIVIEEHKAYILTTEGWELWNQGGGGGGGGAIDVFIEGATDGHADIVDDFDEGNLDERWSIEHTPSEHPSEFFEEAGGHIKKLGGGAPMLRDGATGTDARLVTKFGGEESFACIVEHILRRQESSESNRLVAGYSGGIGHGNPAKIWIGLEGISITFAASSFTEPVVGEYWIVSTIEGTVITCGFYTEDPEGGAEPFQFIEADLADEGLEASLEEREEFMGSGDFGLMFVGAPGGEVFLWSIELSGSPDPGYIQDAAYIEFRDGDELSVGSGSGSGAIVTVPSRTGAMGYVNCGEDLTKSRPAFDGVTWLVTGSAGIPEHMAVGDLLIEIGGVLAAQLVKTGSGHFVGL